MARFSTGWSEKASLTRWHLSRGMPEMRMQALQIPGGKRASGCKDLGAGVYLAYSRRSENAQVGRGGGGEKQDAR